ncbi:MAG: hypothetical protein J6I64_01415 [Lachnospiraceae bacterium]|nr:hypothetical protein [Lachnospiraceae bacterium]
MRKTNGRGLKAIGAVILSMALLLAVPQLRAYALDGIDTEAECSLLISAAGGYDEMTMVQIPVKLYQVASVDKYAQFTALEGFETLGLSELDDQITASDWETKSLLAAGIVEETQAEPVAELTVSYGAGLVEDLAVGMYLVCMDSVETAEYQYTFSPYLISLPNHNYFQTGNDAWQYDVTVGLKATQTQRYGDLVIEKELKTYNESLGDAVFVFQVEATRDTMVNGTLVEDMVVYSNVLTLNFKEPGMKQARVEDLPAGASVTITEVYSGASYELIEGEDGYTVVILADGAEEGPATVRFVNDYDDRLITGTGVVNHFEFDGFDYEWTPVEDDEWTGHSGENGGE